MARTRHQYLPSTCADLWVREVQDVTVKRAVSEVDNIKLSWGVSHLRDCLDMDQAD